MARTKAKGESKSGIFRRYYTENPKLLKVKGYDAIFNMYKGEFPGREISMKEKRLVSYVKTMMRKKRRMRRKQARAAEMAAAGVVAVRVPKASLIQLEERLDACLALARQADPMGLDDVISHLRRARNMVVVRTNGA